MPRPDSNLPPAAQPWARDVNRQNDQQDVDIAELSRRIDSLSAGDGDQAGSIANMKAGFQADIDKAFAYIKALYALTGQTYPPGSYVPPVAPAAPAAPVTVLINADWSRTWGSSSFYTGGGTETNGTYLYQGSSPENKIGMWHFDLSSVIGKTVTNASMFLSNFGAPYSPTFVAGFGTHSNASAPSGKPGRVNAFDVGWSRGEAKWIALPSWTFGGLSNGSITGFTIGGIGASNSNYAYFGGVGTSIPPTLSVTYNP